MKTVLHELSRATAEVVAGARSAVVCVGAGMASPRTGVVIAPGEVVTVALSAERGESVPVHGANGDLSATVTGFDVASGIALLSVPGLAETVRTRETGVAVGEIGVTVACPIPNDLEARLSMIRCVGGPTRTRGGRRVASYLQTDAARFRGFDGSVLFDADGLAVAITMPTGRREESFLLPMGEVLRIVAELREGTSVGTAYLGVTSTPVKLPVPVGDVTHGLLVTGVEDESPAARAGLLVGAFVVSVAGTPTRTPEELYDALVGRTAGAALPIEVVSSEGAVTTFEAEVVLRS